MSLFESGSGTSDPAPSPDAPLAERMRPRSLDDLVGQDEVLAAGRALRSAIEAGRAGSLLLWGPPGVGKTTLARLIAKHSELVFEPFSAVLSGVKEVREAVGRAAQERAASGRGTLLFVDEIHRFNKAQQDAFLPHVESGAVVLVGASTENPSFSVNAAVLSRCRVVRLELLADDAVAAVLDRALADQEWGLGARCLLWGERVRETLVAHAAGDARRALTVLEAAASALEDGSTITAEVARDALQSRVLAHDKSGDHHFDLLSALHKSLRNSDPQAAIYWLARFLEAGADPLQAARRMLAVASEDVGLADPMALQIATSALTAFQNLGLPEGRLPLAQAALYLASAPKSNSVTLAIDAAMQVARDGRQHPVPSTIRNAPTRLAKQMGHGAGYRYAHDTPSGVAAMECLPEALRGRRFYAPKGWGFEPKMQQRLDEIEVRRQQDAGGAREA